MSAEFPPDPITDDYNPEAWVDPTGLLSKLRTLVQSYVTYPIAQNYPITFTNIVFVTDATLTKMANTSYVYSAVNALLTAANIWTGLNTFGTLNTNAITTNTITATTLALSGTQLVTPMTSTLTYPIVPMTIATNGTVTYGTAGTIGYTLVNSDTYGDYFGGGADTYVETKQSLSIPPGMWYLVGEVICRATYGQINGLSFGFTAPANPITTRPTGFFGGDYNVYFSLSSQNNNTLPFGGGAMTCSAIYTNNTGSDVTVRLFFFRPGYGWVGAGNRGYFTATKIA